MNFSTLLGAALGSAIDGETGGSEVEGAIEGALAAKVVTWVVPLALTYATGWLVLRGIGQLKDRAFGGDHAKA